METRQEREARSGRANRERIWRQGRVGRPDLGGLVGPG